MKKKFYFTGQKDLVDMENSGNGRKLFQIIEAYNRKEEYYSIINKYLNKT